MYFVHGTVYERKDQKGSWTTINPLTGSSSPLGSWPGGQGGPLGASRYLLYLPFPLPARGSFTSEHKVQQTHECVNRRNVKSSRRSGKAWWGDGQDGEGLGGIICWGVLGFLNTVLGKADTPLDTL